MICRLTTSRRWPASPQTGYRTTWRTSATSRDDAQGPESDADAEEKAIAHGEGGPRVGRRRLSSVQATGYGNQDRRRARACSNEARDRPIGWYRLCSVTSTRFRASHRQEHPLEQTPVCVRGASRIGAGLVGRGMRRRKRQFRQSRSPVTGRRQHLVDADARRFGGTLCVDAGCEADSRIGLHELSQRIAALGRDRSVDVRGHDARGFGRQRQLGAGAGHPRRRLDVQPPERRPRRQVRAHPPVGRVGSARESLAVARPRSNDRFPRRTQAVKPVRDRGFTTRSREERRS
jgi:hypothetical protein